MKKGALNGEKIATFVGKKVPFYGKGLHILFADGGEKESRSTRFLVVEFKKDEVVTHITR